MILQTFRIVGHIQHEYFRPSSDPDRFMTVSGLKKVTNGYQTVEDAYE
jgi:hypothetical protein